MQSSSRLEPIASASHETAASKQRTVSGHTIDGGAGPGLSMRTTCSHSSQTRCTLLGLIEQAAAALCAHAQQDHNAYTRAATFLGHEESHGAAGIPQQGPPP